MRAQDLPRSSFPNTPPLYTRRQFHPHSHPTKTKPQLLATSVLNPREISVSLNDIGGLGAVKRDLRLRVLRPLRGGGLRASLWRPVRGVLLYGPPGTGKTMLAKAIAKEVGGACVDFCESWRCIQLYVVLHMLGGRDGETAGCTSSPSPSNRPSASFSTSPARWSCPSGLAMPTSLCARVGRWLQSWSHA